MNWDFHPEALREYELAATYYAEQYLLLNSI